MKFLGIDNVKDASPIIKNGVTIGFEVKYAVQRKRRVKTEEVMMSKTVYIRDFDPIAENGNKDGCYHGFGRSVPPITRTVTKPKEAVQPKKKPSGLNLAAIQKVLNGKK